MTKGEALFYAAVLAICLWFLIGALIKVAI